MSRIFFIQYMAGGWVEGDRSGQNHALSFTRAIYSNFLPLELLHMSPIQRSHRIYSPILRLKPPLTLLTITSTSCSEKKITVNQPHGKYQIISSIQFQSIFLNFTNCSLATISSSKVD